MEEFENIYLDDLQNFDPKDWPNIPKPVIVAFGLLKQAIINHDNSIKSLKSRTESQFENQNQQINNLSVNTKKSLFKSDEITKNKLLELDVKGKYRIKKIKKRMNIQEENRALMAGQLKTIINDNIDLLNKRIDKLPTFEGISETIHNLKNNFKEEFMTETKDCVVKPEMIKVVQRIKDFSV